LKWAEAEAAAARAEILTLRAVFEARAVESEAARVAETAALRAEIVRLAAQKGPKEYGLDGKAEGSKAQRRGNKLRREHAEALIIKAQGDNRALTRSKLVEEATKPKNWEGSNLKPLADSKLYEIIRDLLKNKRIDPPPSKE
jgi:hypothetical protein